LEEDPVKTGFITPPKFLPLLLAFAVFAGCNRSRSKPGEPAYVSAPQVNLRDRVAAIYNRQGIVKNGDRVEILEHDRRFARVRTAAGLEGWVEQRYLVTQEVYDGFQKLEQSEKDAPVQGTATTRNDTNLHVAPGRDTEHLYQLNQSAKISLLRRAAAARPGATAKPSAKSADQTPQPVLEDWWLVRDSAGRVGWVLGRMTDVDIPLEVAQYSEGQRIVASFVLSEVVDEDKKIPQYLVLFTESKDGLPFDYNQARVFTWNAKRNRYETAYRERLSGVLPVTVTKQSFDKEGTLPVFVLRTKDDSGNVVEKRYKLNSPIVRRVYAPGEQPAARASAPRRRLAKRKRR
jgi:SH3-like domain-containing protein